MTLFRCKMGFIHLHQNRGVNGCRGSAGCNPLKGVVATTCTNIPPHWCNLHRICTTCTIALNIHLKNDCLIWIIIIGNFKNTADVTAATHARLVGDRIVSPIMSMPAGNPLASDVGRCEHLSKCGYHKTPAQYFAENPQERERKACYLVLPQLQKEEVATDYIPYSLIQRSESMKNNLMRYLGRYSPG